MFADGIRGRLRLAGRLRQCRSAPAASYPPRGARHVAGALAIAGPLRNWLDRDRRSPAPSTSGSGLGREQASASIGPPSLSAACRWRRRKEAPTDRTSPPYASSASSTSLSRASFPPPSEEVARLGHRSEVRRHVDTGCSGAQAPEEGRRSFARDMPCVLFGGPGRIALHREMTDFRGLAQGPKERSPKVDCRRQPPG